MFKKTDTGPIHPFSSPIDTFRSVTISNTSSPFDYFLLNTVFRFQKNDRSNLGFVDLEKIHGISNSDLPLIIAIVIIDLTTTELLVDDRSSYNILYEETLESLGHRRTNLSPMRENTCYLSSLRSFILVER